jgi:hypothetical protein
VIRNHDVHRSASIAAAKAVNRSISNAIYCCVNEHGVSGTGVLDLCSIALEVYDNFQRIFLSATVSQVWALQSDGETPSTYGVNLWIADEGTGTIIIPGISTITPYQGHSLTGAVDLPPGSYNWILRMSAGGFGEYAFASSSSEQLIVGQIVPVQQCVHVGGGCG